MILFYSRMLPPSLFGRRNKYGKLYGRSRKDAWR